MLLNLINYRRVVECGFVVGEIDGLRLSFQQVDAAASVIVAFFESLEGGCCLAFQTEGGGDFSPVEF